MSKTIDGWMAELGSAAPTPGGGGAAAMSVAMGAGLLEMVCNLTIGRPRYAAREDELRKVRDRAAAVRQQAVTLIDEDAAAFGAVMAAYGLPKDDDAAKAERQAAIQLALRGAADVAARTAELAGEVIGTTAGVSDGVNVNVISDIAVAAASASAGLTASIVNVEVNVAALADEAARAELRARIDRLRADVDTADQIVQAVRDRINA